MTTWIHGGDIVSAKERIEGEILDFSANLNPIGLPSSARQALIQSIDTWSAYPDPFCRALVLKLAEIEELPPTFFLCGNGAADLIVRLVWAVEPKKALIIEPTFSEYAQALSSQGCQIIRHQLREEDNFMVKDSMLSAMEEDFDIMFLCNPNNPTGHTIAPALLRRILARCSACGTLLVVDECFIEFVDDSAEHTLKNWTKLFPNLILLRAFTKSFGMAGLRLGYCITGNKKLIKKLAVCGQPWGVSTPAQVAGVAALGDRAYWENTKSLIQEERAYLCESLGQLGLAVLGSEANFIFFRLDEDIPLPELLEESGILIRSCANFNGLSELYYRVAVRSHRENASLIFAMKKIFKPDLPKPALVPQIEEVIVVAPLPKEKPVALNPGKALFEK